MAPAPRHQWRATSPRNSRRKSVCCVDREETNRAVDNSPARLQKSAERYTSPTPEHAERPLHRRETRVESLPTLGYSSMISSSPQTSSSSNSASCFSPAQYLEYLTFPHVKALVGHTMILTPTPLHAAKQRAVPITTARTSPKAAPRMHAEQIRRSPPIPAAAVGKTRPGADCAKARSPRQFDCAPRAHQET